MLTSCQNYTDHWSVVAGRLYHADQWSLMLTSCQNSTDHWSVVAGRLYHADQWSSIRDVPTMRWGVSVPRKPDMRRVRVSLHPG